MCHFASLVSKLSSVNHNAPMHSSPNTFIASCTCETWWLFHMCQCPRHMSVGYITHMQLCHNNNLMWTNLNYESPLLSVMTIMIFQCNLGILGVFIAPMQCAKSVLVPWHVLNRALNISEHCYCKWRECAHARFFLFTRDWERPYLRSRKRFCASVQSVSCNMRYAIAQLRRNVQLKGYEEKNKSCWLGISSVQQSQKGGTIFCGVGFEFFVEAD